MTDKDNITLPREVVQEAVEALEYMTMTAEHRVDNRIPDSAIAALRKALAAEQPKQEPVAWGVRAKSGGELMYAMVKPQPGWQSLGVLEMLPLYTALAAEQPSGDVEALRRDAERYRYLRNRDPKEVFNKSGKAAGVWIDWEDDLSGLQLLTGDDADAAIDAAMGDKR